MHRSHSVSEEPIAAWLEMVEARRGPALSGLLVFALAATVASAPAGFYLFLLGMELLNWLLGQSPGSSSLLGPDAIGALRSALGAGAAVALFTTLTLVPLCQAGLYARVLSSFRKARTLEELAGTPMTAGGVLDSLARHSAFQSLKTLVAPVALCLLYLALAGEAGPGWDWALLPLGLALFWHYGFLAAAAWDRSGGWLGAFGAALSVAGTLACLLILEVTLTLLSGVPGALLGTALACLPAVVGLRLLAAQGLDEASPLRRALGRCTRAVNRRSAPYRAATPNAMLFRERAVRSGGFGRRLLKVHGPVLLVLAMALAAFQGVSEDPATAFLVALGLIACVSISQALHASSMGLYNERQQGTLDLLQQSGLPVRDYVSGCVRAASDKGMADVLLAAGVGLVAVLSLSAGMGSLAWLLALSATGVVAVESAAVWGAALAADCRKRPQPVVVVLTYVTAVGVAVLLTLPGAGMLVALVALGIGPAAATPSAAPLLLAGVLAGLWMVRAVAWKSALHTLTQRGAHIGFVP